MQVSTRIALRYLLKASPASYPYHITEHLTRAVYSDGMKAQNQIKRALSQPGSIERIGRLLAAEPELKRTRLADLLCDEFGFVDACGRRQRAGCVKALRRLELQGRVKLPPRRRKRTVPSPRRLEAAVPEPNGVPAEVGSIAGLKLVLVQDGELIRVWNELMAREHPLGAGPLVGRQLRYLIGSEHGWLGGIGFAAAALHLRDRDAWIGWDTEGRGAHLDKVVGLARFLIRPSVRCSNLASHVLGLCAKAVRSDFERRYGYAPLLLETFVDTSGFPGTCFRAANWVQVGQTQGRGRQDHEMKAGKSVKRIYVYALAEDFRQQLGLPAGSGRGALGVADGLDGESWAGQEFGAAELGDCRLTRRLVNMAKAKAENPTKAWTEITKGDWPATKGCYRFIDQPDDSRVTLFSILQPHRERTIQRLQAQQTVLCIQDGTDLNYTNLDQCEGLHSLGTNQTGAQSKGLHLHSTLAVTPGGLPLGVLRADCPQPPPEPPRVQGRNGELTAPRSYQVPIEQKKTFAWIEGLRDLNGIARQAAGTRIVSVMDREADFFELFDEWRQAPRIDLLVRAMYERKTATGTRLFETVRNTRVRHRFSILIPRQSARPKRSGQKARPARKGRVADVALRSTRVRLQAPDYPGQQEKLPIEVWIIHIVEQNAPPGVEPLEWFLLTTIPVGDVETALQCVRWYCLRWRIEDWHRVLKSGCRIEQVQHNTADRIRRAVAINLVVAWRIMLMTLLGREVPELPADVLFSDTELEVLRRYAKERPETAADPRRGSPAGGTAGWLPGPRARSPARARTDMAGLRGADATLPRVLTQRCLMLLEPGYG
jgi:hypothetical protein